MSRLYASAVLIPALIAFAVPSQTEFPLESAAVEAVAERHAETAPLRVSLDLARGRRWELSWDGARAYDIATGELTRHVRLPGATFAAARDSSPPDMLLSRSGALFVSSNTEPRLWRISPARFEVEVYDIELASDNDKDVGFQDLAWGASERTLYAKGSPQAVAWKIDLTTGTAARLGY